MLASSAAQITINEHLTSRDFRRLASFIQDYAGIKMPEAKRTMVEGRLRRRLRALGLSSMEDYCRYFFESGGLQDEIVHLINAVSTNKTDFFREPDHFNYLAQQAVPRLLARRHVSRHVPLKMWSAACSTGAEPYTMAMVATELANVHSGLRASILATDISTDVLETAIAGIYSEQMVQPVPPTLRQRYLMRGRGAHSEFVRIVPELRAMVAFGRLNLMEDHYPVEDGFHVIFCRNVLIYFDKATQKHVLEQLCRHLHPGGYLIVGHSETVAGLGLPLSPVATTVFQLDHTP